MRYECRNMILKGEIEILRSIALNKCKTKQIINSKIVRDNVYVIATFDSMVKNGLIQESRPREYRLTLKGVRTLLELGGRSKILKNILPGEILGEYTDKSLLY